MRGVNRERRVELCEKAAVEQDPAKLLELTSEANMTSGRKNLPVGVLLVVVLLLGLRSFWLNRVTISRNRIRLRR
jgi:hypothetical protein